MRKTNRRRTNGSAYPPSIDVPILVGKKYRFVTSAAISGRLLTFTEICDLLCMAATTTSAYRIMTAVRLRAIEIWASAPSLDSPVTVSFQARSTTAGMSGRSQQRSDTSMGFDRPAHIKYIFSEREQVGQWQNANSTAIYGEITVPKGAVIDLTYTAAVQESSSTPFAVAGAVAGATVGQIYLRALDNGQATPQIIPASYLTI